MPQVFQVLRCCTCEKFQVHQTKKAKKWSCKICEEKQSYVKIYFTGSAPECRAIVQKFNFQDGERKTMEMLAGNFNCSSGRYGEEEFDEEDVPFFSNECVSKKFKKENGTPTVAENLQAALHCFNPVNNYSSDNHLTKRTTCESGAKMPIYVQEQVPCVLAEKSNYNVSYVNKTAKQQDKNKDSVLKSEILPINPPVVKNKGFQKILEAAKKLS